MYWDVTGGRVAGYLPQSGRRVYSKEFEARTGIGGVLNTSFNIHGEPIVCTPDDALSTFSRLGLRYLALDNVILSKQDPAEQYGALSIPDLFVESVQR